MPTREGGDPEMNCRLRVDRVTEGRPSRRAALSGQLAVALRSLGGPGPPAALRPASLQAGSGGAALASAAGRRGMILDRARAPRPPAAGHGSRAAAAGRGCSAPPHDLRVRLCRRGSLGEAAWLGGGSETSAAQLGGVQHQLSRRIWAAPVPAAVACAARELRSGSAQGCLINGHELHLEDKRGVGRNLGLEANTDIGTHGHGEWDERDGSMR